MDAGSRSAAEAGAWRDIQAKYGAQPKEARPVKKALDKDDFLRIMITEMKHQDPTKPMDSDRMATQMAQMTSVEQLQNLGKAMDKMTEKSNVADRMVMSAMIGQTVTVDKGRFNHTKNTMSPVNFNLPEDAEKVKLNVLDEAGEVIFAKELEPMKKGMNNFAWDGSTENGTKAKAGTYLVRIDAEGKSGNTIKVDPISKDKVIGISFEGGQSQFLVGDLKNPQKVPFSSVIKIEGEMASAQKMVNAQPSADSSAAVQGKSSEGGAHAFEGAASGTSAAVESEPANLSNAPFQLPKEVQERMAEDLRNKRLEAAKPDVSAKPEGFPSGMNESDATNLSASAEGSLGIPGVNK